MVNSINSLSELQDKAKEIVKILIKRYGKKIPTYLHYDKNKLYEFLFAVIMSAQCKDERVNEVTKKLYKKYDSLEKFAGASVNDFEKEIFSLGFYHNKAKNIIDCAKVLIEKYDGKVPKSFDDLVALPGVGRKTANVVLGQLYNIPAMAVDTHVKRISKKLFDIKSDDVVVIEEMLMQIVEKKYWALWNTHIIAFGREICIANRPKCEICPMKKYCVGRG